MTAIPKTSPRAARLLLIGCSSLALSVPAAANEMIFSSTGAQLRDGERTSQSSGVTQIALTGGGTVSIVDAADYRINQDGSVELYAGTITVSGCDGCEVVVRMPKGLEGVVGGEGSSGRFSVAADGESTGHTLGGEVRVGQSGRGMRKYHEGMMWSAEPGRAPRRTIANAAVAQPGSSAKAEPEIPQVASISDDAGPVAAALNGIPVTLGDGLAAAGASSDIIEAGRRVEAAAANPSIETFPSGDFALLISAAAQLEGAYGGRPFNAAQADVIRTYLRFLASGGAQADFLAAYSGFVLDYLDLIRAGGVPSGFASGAASAADIDAYLAFIGRTGAIADLAARDRVLADAYLAFIASGGNRDLFAASFTDLTAAYFAFLRAGGVPTDFTGASQAALSQSIAFLRQSGLDQQLSAADRALITAFLENGGIAFASQFQTALDAYFAYLASGRLPSDYDALDQATLRAYLETLANTGLLDAVLADQAAFYSEYLAFLRAGGEVDAFAGLPANIFAGYAVQLDAYFAFLAAGNLPSQFTAADIAQLQSFILQLQDAGALDRFLGANQAAFFASFGQFVADGGAFDNFAGLNANIFAGYALDLQAYFEFLSSGGIPSGYTVLSQETIAAYIAALEAAGATDRFLLDLTEFYQAYFQFVLGGGNPDNFAGLPVPPDFPAFADALNAYAVFLAANGLPSEYSDEDIARLQAFFAAVLQSGQVDSLLGANGDLLTAYFAFLEAGGQIDAFAGLPIYLDYVAALNAYAAFLSGGGLPSDYATLDLSILRAYLDALAGLPGGLAGFEGLADNAALISAYFAFVSAGGDIDGFTGLPIYADYIAALNAYFEFLANGGLPSEYTALDLAILEAYLAALAALQGGLAGFADLNDFFLDYYEFLLGGGDPDQFAGLPGNGGGNGGGNPAFATTIPDALFVVSFGGGSISPRQATLEVAENGQILDAVQNGSTVSLLGAPNIPFDERGWEVLDAGRFGDVVAYTSYLDPDSEFADNFVFNFLGGVRTIVLPQTGIVNYSLLGGAAPTEQNTALGSEGYFTGNLAVAYGGSSPRVGLDFEVTSQGTTYATGTAGGAADPLNGGLAVNSSGAFAGFFPAVAIEGEGCVTAAVCSARVDGGLFGENASHVGFVYFLNDTSDLSAFRLISGSAVFGRDGAAVQGLGTLGAGQGATGTGTPILLGSPVDFAGTSGVKYNFTSPTNVLNGFDATAVTFDENQGVIAIDDGFSPRAIGTARVTDVSSNARFAIGRWTDGTYETNNAFETATLTPAQGFHYLFAGPTSGAFTLPTLGRIDYDLIAATAPTIGDGSLEPGRFEADMAILFGTVNRIAMEGSITLPKEGGDYVYSFASDGGMANPEQSDSEFRVTFGRNVNFQFDSGQITTNDNSCDNTCIIQFAGYFAGDDVNELGVTYTAQNGTFGQQISGAAIFGNGVYDDGTGGGSSLSGTLQNTAIFQSSPIFITSGSAATTAVDQNGRITGFFNANGAPISLGDSVGVTASKPGEVKESGRVGDIMAWTSYRDPSDTAGPNHTSHYIAGVTSFDRPTTGVVNYALIGGTAPTNAALADGTSGYFTGQLSVAFGSTPRLGLTAEVFSNGDGYRFGTVGGAADPTNGGLSISTFGKFDGFFDATPISGNACNGAGNCIASINGNMFGANYSHAGMAYAVRDGDVTLRGTAAFAANGTAIPGVGNSGAVSVGGGQSTASIAPTVSPIAGGDWSRWMGGAGVNPPAVGSIDANIAFDPVADLRQTVAGAEGRPANAAQRDWAIDQVERIMGGMITFNGETRAEP